MRTGSTAMMCIAILLVLAIPVAAQSQEVTKAGKITCAKCELKTEKECATVIVTKEGGKDVTYYLDEKAHKANHDAICQAGKEGTVTGTVSEKAGKKIITASKVDLKK